MRLMQCQFVKHFNFPNLRRGQSTNYFVFSVVPNIRTTQLYSRSTRVQALCILASMHTTRGGTSNSTGRYSMHSNMHIMHTTQQQYQARSIISTGVLTSAGMHSNSMDNTSVICIHNMMQNQPGHTRYLLQYPQSMHNMRTVCIICILSAGRYSIVYRQNFAY